MDLTPALPEPKGSKETVLKVRCFKEASFRGSEGALSAGVVPEKGSRRGCPSCPWVYPYGTVQETSEILILADINGAIAQLSAMADL